MRGFNNKHVIYEKCDVVIFYFKLNEITTSYIAT